MGKRKKRSEQDLRAEAHARVEELPAESAAGRLEGGSDRPEARESQHLDERARQEREQQEPA